MPRAPLAPPHVPALAPHRHPPASTAKFPVWAIWLLVGVVVLPLVGAATLAVVIRNAARNAGKPVSWRPVPSKHNDFSIQVPSDAYVVETSSEHELGPLLRFTVQDQSVWEVRSIHIEDFDDKRVDEYLRKVVHELQQEYPFPGMRRSILSQSDFLHREMLDLPPDSEYFRAEVIVTRQGVLYILIAEGEWGFEHADTEPFFSGFKLTGSLPPRRAKSAEPTAGGSGSRSFPSGTPPEIFIVDSIEVTLGELSEIPVIVKWPSKYSGSAKALGLPPGMRLKPDGTDYVIIGRPEATGSFLVDLEARDGTALGVARMDIVVKPSREWVVTIQTPAELPDAQAGTPFKYALEARSGKGSVEWEPGRYVFPAGVELVREDNAWYLKGTLAKAGTYSMEVVARNAHDEVRRSFKLKVK